MLNTFWFWKEGILPGVAFWVTYGRHVLTDRSDGFFFFSMQLGLYLLSFTNYTPAHHRHLTELIY